MRRTRVALLIAVLTVLVTALLSAVTNIATGLLPARLTADSALVWVALILLVIALVAVAVWQAVHEARSREPETLRSGHPGRPAPAQLPADRSDLTGRGREVATLRSWLMPPRSGRPATVAIAGIVGRPGVGKSALAIHLAHELARRFPDGQLYANLRGGERAGERLTPVQVLGQFLRALGRPAEALSPDLVDLVAEYRTELAGRRMLVVLDNAADGNVVRPLIPGGPTCAVLVTSRDSLAGLPGARVLELDLLGDRDSLDLLARSVGRERVDAEPDAAAAIVRYCGGLPLALLLVGDRLRTRPTWPLGELAARLADEHRRLAELRAGGESEVRASFALGYRELREPASRTFRLLGVLDGPDLTPGVAAALTSRSEAEAEAVLEELAALHLLEEPSPSRYRFHDLLRLFARERLAAEESVDTADAALAAALDWYLSMAAQATDTLLPSALRTPAANAPFAGSRAALSWLEEERPNLVAAVEQAWSHHFDDRCRRLGSALVPYFELRKYWDDWQRTAELGVRAAVRGGDRAGEAVALIDLGSVLRERSRLTFDEAAERLERAVDLATEAGDRAIQARALAALGVLRHHQRRADDALRCLERALVMHAELGQRLAQGDVLLDLAIVRRSSGRLDDAESLLESALATYREVGARRGEGRTLAVLGLVRAERGDDAGAVACLDKSLALLRATDDVYNAARTLRHLGTLHARLGDDRTAIRLLEESLATFVQFRIQYQQGATLRSLAKAVARTRGAAAARRYWEAANEFRDVLSPGVIREIEAGLAGRPPAADPEPVADPDDEERAGAAR